jgi:hypothetical protein
LENGSYSEMEIWDVTGAMMGLIELTGGEILLTRDR